MNVEILVRPLCFGNFGFEKPECGPCPFHEKCMDDQAGWAVSYVLKQFFQLETVEKLARREGVSPLLDILDEIPEEDVGLFLAKNPKLQKFYQMWSTGSIKIG